MINENEFNLSLIRHGESEINATPDIIGQTFDAQLTEKGKVQAQKLCTRLLKKNEKFDYIYSSPYDRALNTAQLAIPNDSQKIILSPEIREYNAGDWTGTSRALNITLAIKTKMNYLNQAFLPPNGESFAMVERRAATWLENEILYNPKMIEESNRRKKSDEAPLNLVCFTHGGTIKCLLHYVVGFDRNFLWKIKIDNTSITRLSFGEEGWRLIGINDCFHLEAF